MQALYCWSATFDVGLEVGFSVLLPLSFRPPPAANCSTLASLPRAKSYEGNTHDGKAIPSTPFHLLTTPTQFVLSILKYCPSRPGYFLPKTADQTRPRQRLPSYGALCQSPSHLPFSHTFSSVSVRGLEFFNCFLRNGSLSRFTYASHTTLFPFSP